MAEDQFPAADHLGRGGRQAARRDRGASGLSGVQDPLCQRAARPRTRPKRLSTSSALGTFSDRALKLTQDTKGNQLAVPQ